MPESLTVLNNRREYMCVVNTFRDEIYYIPFFSAMYYTYLARAARCVWDVSYPLNDIRATGRYIDCNGHYHYTFNHGGMQWEVD